MEETIPLIRIQQVEDVRLARDDDVGQGESGGEEGAQVSGARGRVLSAGTSRDEDDDDSSNNASSESKSPGQRRGRVGSSSTSSRVSSKEPDRADSGNEKRGHKWRNVQAVMAYYQTLRKIKRTKSNQRWMKLRTTVQLSSAMQMKKPPLKREDSFLKRFSTRQIPETQETVEDTGSEGAGGGEQAHPARRRRRVVRAPRSVVNPDENFYFYWLWLITGCVLYNLWTLIVRQSFPELQAMAHYFWVACDGLSDMALALDILVQLRTGYLEQGLMVYDSKKLARHYLASRAFLFDTFALTPLDLVQFKIGTNPIVRFPRFLKVYRAVSCYYIVESRTVYPNFWRVINLIHILLILAHWFGCFYFLLSEAEGFQGDWVYPHRPGDYATLTRKYLGSLYWSTLTLTTIGDLPTPETNADALGTEGPKFLPRRGLKSRLLQFKSNRGYVFTIVSYLIGVFIFATIVGQVGNVITNRNANRLEFERLLDGAKTYMRHHKVPGGMKRRVLRWYDYSWSRGRIQGGGDINTALGLLPDKLKTELALHVNLSVLKKVTIFQECQPEFLHDLVLKMKAYIFTPGDSICRKGEVAREMFIIADGILEVISETGRVLTTMKAGDFFGEIGILNLDGLNKRTADVRSVGYSELFSLSREDVLAAMKDYPEAQDILQTLGRKRLQEARNCSRQSRKGEASPDKLGDDSGPKRIVHKIRSDVKGIRNALRNRSRVTRRSGVETLELHALSGGDGSTGIEMGSKGVLRRMPRVESDEYTQHNEDMAGGATMEGSKNAEKVISPIGAGLPLLARLKLLKERQDREEKVVKQRMNALSVISAGVAGGGGGLASEPEPEVIGPGLPLLQRLLLLKAKEAKEAKEEHERNRLTLISSNQPSSSDTISPSSLKSPLSPTVKTISPIRKCSDPNYAGKLNSPIAHTSRKNSSGSSDGTTKPKVSFKDKILQVQSDGTSISQPLQKESEEMAPTGQLAEPSTKSDSISIISIPHTVVNKLKSPAKAISTTFRDKLKQLHGGALQKEGMEIPVIEKSKLPLILHKSPIDISIVGKEELKANKPWTKLKKASILGETKNLFKSSIETRSEKNSEVERSKEVEKMKSSMKTGLVNVDNNNFKVQNHNTSLEIQNPKISLTSPLDAVQESTTDLLIISPSKKSVSEISLPSSPRGEPKTLLPTNTKNYISIDDLSPEYGGLSFVKKLEILNERQKLAELEKIIKTRSSSLDYTSSCEDLLVDTLTRSHSEGSNMNQRKCKRKESLGSRESNETLERRTLKSILKKLSEDITPTDSPQRGNKDLKKLIRAPTLEGYAIRHSKFAKSVTFNRHTLPSPPSSAANEPTDCMFTSVQHEIIKNMSPSPPQTSPLIPGIPATVLEETPTILCDESAPICEFDFQPEFELHQQLDPMYGIKRKGIATLRPEEIKVPSEKPKLSLISAVANQRKLLRGSVEEQEYFGEVLLGIKQVIQGHLNDVQGKFQDRFNSLENEVRKRDEIINQLQSRIQELERLGLSVLSPNTPQQQVQPTTLTSSTRNYSQQPLGTCEMNSRVSSGLDRTASSSSDDLSLGGQGFMRGDSLDTVFATSPPPQEQLANDTSPILNYSRTDSTEITEERLARMTEGIDLDALSYSELRNLAESLSQRERTESRNNILELRLDSKSGTYARRRAAKMRQRKSWEEHSDQESMELYELTRPMSPQTMAEDRSLLSPGESSPRSGRRALHHPFHFFGSHLDSTRSKIKKTLSVDTGMHQTGRKSAKYHRDCEHRKFSLGSFFGYHRSSGSQHKSSSANSRDGAGLGSSQCNEVVLDIGSDCSWSDNSANSTSSDSDSLPRTPAFEHFIDATMSLHQHSAHSAASDTLSDNRAGSMSRGGSDWEILMLAEELEKRERVKERQQHHYDRILRDLEEESDTPPTPLREDSVEEIPELERAPPPSPSRYPHPPPHHSPATQLRSRKSGGLSSGEDRGQHECRQRAASCGKLTPAGAGAGSGASRGGLILRAASLDQTVAEQYSPARRAPAPAPPHEQL